MDYTIKLGLHRGKVLDINDPDKKGKIQVKLLPEMVDIADKNCPWIPPFFGNSSSNEMKNNPPQVDSLIWVLADKEFMHRYYMNTKYNIEGKFDYSKIESILGAIDGLDSEYQNIIFELYEDESLSFHNRNDGSHGFISSNGAFTVIDSAGNILANGDEDNAVRYSSLETAYNELNDKFNALISVLEPIITGTPILEPGNGIASALQASLKLAWQASYLTFTPPVTTLESTGDIEPAKVENVLLP